MELIYIFIEEYRNFKNAELSLSGKFDIKYDKENDRIVINRNENYQDIYPKHIRNINALVGRNSVGKTNLIDLIGMKIEDRNKGGSEHKLIYRNKLISHHNIPDDIEGDVWYAKYFMIFYLGNNNGEDLFCIEGNRAEDVLGIFNSNIPDENYFKSKPWFSFGCTYKNSKLNYMYDMSERLGEYRTEGLKIFGDYRAERDKLAVISFRNNYKPQIYDNTSYKPEDDYLISVPRRIAKLQSNQWTKKVNMLIYLMSHNNDIGVAGSMFADNKYQLVITYQEAVWWDNDTPYKKIYNDVNKNIRNKCKVIESFLSYLYQLQDSDTKESIATKLKEFNNYETIIYSNPFAYYQNIANSMIELIVDENASDRKSILDEFTSRYNGFIKSLDNRYIQITNKDIRIDITPHTKMSQIENVIDELLDKDYIETTFNEKFSFFNGFFDCDIRNLSDGEMYYLGVYASMSEQLDDQKFILNKDNIILLFDEPETSMHPDLARNFINDIIEFLGRIANGRKFQIIISTHSPFILSDLQKENVLLLEKDSDGISQIKKCDISTFGSNIHNILSNGFFMDSTIGEYAKRQINEVISILYDEEPNKDNDNYIPKSKMEYIISQIGEPILKNKLQAKFNEKYRADYENQNRQFFQLLGHIEKSPESMFELKNRVDEYFRKRNNWGEGDTNE